LILWNYFACPLPVGEEVFSPVPSAQDLPAPFELQQLFALAAPALPDSVAALFGGELHELEATRGGIDIGKYRRRVSHQNKCIEDIAGRKRTIAQTEPGMDNKHDCFYIIILTQI